LHVSEIQNCKNAALGVQRFNGNFHSPGIHIGRRRSHGMPIIMIPVAGACLGGLLAAIIDDENCKCSNDNTEKLPESSSATREIEVTATQRGASAKARADLRARPSARAAARLRERLTRASNRRR
jgi:hypothetical protein